MKRQLVHATLVFGFLLAYSATLTSLVADDTAPEKAQKAKRRQYTGKIISISPGDRSVVVEKKEGDSKSFNCIEKCSFINESKDAIELSDFKVGDKVTCWFQENDGKLNCHRMMRKPMNGKSKGTPAEEDTEE